MKTKSFLRCCAIALALAFASSLFSAESTAPSSATAAVKSPTFLILLRLTPKYHDMKAWTDADNAVVGVHFKRLQEAVAAGSVIIAGRTQEAPAQTLGLIIFTAADEASARKFLNDDPCIVAGMMTGTLHPYSIAVKKN